MRAGGFNAWADANDLVVLYPNAQADERLGNPNGCWDWWAYTDASYGLRDGVQMAFAKRLVDALLHQ
jgi:poly(3-hydroxybutyrate) depolymerase